MHNFVLQVPLLALLLLPRYSHEQFGSTRERDRDVASTRAGVRYSPQRVTEVSRYGEIGVVSRYVRMIFK